MPLATETIGTGETYTTPPLWIASLDNAAQYTGQCKAEAFSDDIIFIGVAYTSSNYPLLTSVVGAEHDGRAHEVSGAGNARIEYTGTEELLRLDNPSDYIEVSWLEFKGPGENSSEIMRPGPGGAGSHSSVHHCILHNNAASANTNNQGVDIAVVDSTFNFYRNIVYGTGGNANVPRSGTGNLLHNTAYSTNNKGFVTKAAWNVSSNASFDCVNADLDVVDMRQPSA